MESEKKLTLTENWLREHAVSYASMETKERFVGDCAMRCFDKMEIGTENGEPMPPYYKENAVLKSKYMLGALLIIYLDIKDVELAGEDDPWMPSAEACDAYFASFPMSQLERIKKTTQDKELRDKIYDMLSDYRALEKLLNAECYGLLPAMNDTLSRFQMMMSAQTTPEAMEALMTATEDMKRELEEIKAAKE
mgnify:CR=1 FL=1